MHYSIATGGAGGHGVLLFGKLLAVAGTAELGHAAFVPVYDPEIHGSPVNSFVILSSEPLVTPVVSRYDAVVAFDDRSVREHVPKVRPGGLVVYNSTLVSDVPDADARIVAVPASDIIANDLKNPKLINMVMLGAFVEASGVLESRAVIDGLRETLPAHRHSLIPDNERAMALGAGHGVPAAAAS